ncbi:hypothetical protein T492DRAFT_169109 [Pavlovales sp. CCMP2436]|nr:hypothetical protein T492DRAFT_169109 [Pavlovales sp. CCMP2436]
MPLQMPLSTPPPASRLPSLTHQSTVALAPPESALPRGPVRPLRPERLSLPPPKQASPQPGSQPPPPPPGPLCCPPGAGRAVPGRRHSWWPLAARPGRSRVWRRASPEPPSPPREPASPRLTSPPQRPALHPHPDKQMHARSVGWAAGWVADWAVGLLNSPAQCWALRRTNARSTQVV